MPDPPRRSAGTEIRFEPGRSMVVTAGASLSAIGTADEPIVLTATTSNPGSWGARVIGISVQGGGTLQAEA